MVLSRFLPGKLWLLELHADSDVIRLGSITIGAIDTTPIITALVLQEAGYRLLPTSATSQVYITSSMRQLMASTDVSRTARASMAVQRRWRSRRIKLSNLGSGRMLSSRGISETAAACELLPAHSHYHLRLLANPVAVLSYIDSELSPPESNP